MATPSVTRQPQCKPQPRGRPPRGKQWDANSGEWVPISTASIGGTDDIRSKLPSADKLVVVKSFRIPLLHSPTCLSMRTAFTSVNKDQKEHVLFAVPMAHDDSTATFYKQDGKVWVKLNAATNSRHSSTRNEDAQAWMNNNFNLVQVSVKNVPCMIIEEEDAKVTVQPLDWNYDDNCFWTLEKSDDKNWVKCSDVTEVEMPKRALLLTLMCAGVNKRSQILKLSKAMNDVDLSREMSPSERTVKGTVLFSIEDLETDRKYTPTNDAKEWNLPNILQHGLPLIFLICNRFLGNDPEHDDPLFKMVLDYLYSVCNNFLLLDWNCSESSRVSFASPLAVAVEASQAQEFPDVTDVPDELQQMISSSQQKAAENKAMAERVERDLQESMDVGIRLNIDLARAHHVAVPQHMTDSAAPSAVDPAKNVVVLHAAAVENDAEDVVDAEHNAATGPVAASAQPRNLLTENSACEEPASQAYPGRTPADGQLTEVSDDEDSDSLKLPSSKSFLKVLENFHTANSSIYHEAQDCFKLKREEMESCTQKRKRDWIDDSLAELQKQRVAIMDDFQRIQEEAETKLEAGDFDDGFEQEQNELIKSISEYCSHGAHLKKRLVEFAAKWNAEDASSIWNKFESFQTRL